MHVSLRGHSFTRSVWITCLTITYQSQVEITHAHVEQSRSITPVRMNLGDTNLCLYQERNIGKSKIGNSSLSALNAILSTELKRVYLGLKLKSYKEKASNSHWNLKEGMSVSYYRLCVKVA